MSTSSAGTHVNFGSQEMPEPEAETREPPERGGRASTRRRSAPPAAPPELETELEAELETGSVHGAGLPAAPPGARQAPQLAATSSVAAEAQQGDGPAAASASGSAVGETNVASRAVSVVIGPHGAAAACELGVAVVGPQGAAAASNIGVASAGPGGAAAAGNGANSSTVAIDGGANGHPAALPEPDSLEQRLARLERENDELRRLVDGNGNGHAATRHRR